MLLDYWLSAGDKTQLWTTARNAALLLLEHGHSRPAASLLVAADNAGSAATISGDTAVRMQQATPGWRRSCPPPTRTRCVGRPQQ